MICLIALFFVTLLSINSNDTIAYGIERYENQNL